MFYERLPKQSSPYLFIMIRWFFCAFFLFRYVLLYFCYFLRSTFLCFLFSFGCTDITTTSREMFMRGSCANFSQNNIFWSCGCFCWSLFFRCGCVFFFFRIHFHRNFCIGKMKLSDCFFRSNSLLDRLVRLFHSFCSLQALFFVRHFRVLWLRNCFRRYCTAVVDLKLK